MHRLITRAASASALAGAVLLVVAPTASAHVTVDSSTTTPGKTALLTFKVPNESETGSPTTELTVKLPPVKSAMTAPVAGWHSVLTRSADGVPTSVTWTVDPGSPGIGRDQFGMFVLRVGPLPSAASVDFPATQKYADGTVVAWDQKQAPGATEPEHPAPSVVLGAAGSTAAKGNSDATARWLGAAGLVAGLIGLALGALALRRAA
ncbi:YcnI family protein [Tsukamurella sp. 8F]|uniref:YcnI family copper-binding membrane protein n=1 Tax=unclassified Tsukamurella TaxID=2633480 RepID=UPI0023B9EB25|nr:MULTISPECIES: YcnI family protein [unclassified Tsukamurella]MDF0530594.1 YcnI family protein [Tsukamurella sp. 8J]MDF0587795.1 YcnI family protein [Tsukamurella sp. 8F]